MSDSGIIRRILEQYLAGQQEAADAEAAMTEEEIAAAEMMPIMTGEQMNFAGMVSPYDLEGDPYSMTSMLNQLQDVNQLLADPLFQGGGGVGGWSQQAFAPIVNYEVVDSPEYQQWMNYINTPLSPEGMIAAELREGGTPMSAIRKIQQRVTEDPAGQLAQEMAIFFPSLDFDGQPTGEIDWTKASDAAAKIDEIRSKVPPIGGTGSITMPDGTVVPAGEIMEVDGQLVKRTEEPSEIAQHFNELGLPSPFEEYTAGSFLGPEWEAENQAWQASQAAIEPFDVAMRQAYESMLRNADWVPPAGPAPAEGEAEGEGEPRPRPVPGPGMPTAPQGTDTGYWMPQGSQQARFQSGYAIQDPEEWRQWYEEHLPEMDENQRWEALTYAQDRSFSGASPETMARWSTVFNDLKSDLVTEGGTIPGDIATALTEPYEPTAADAVMNAARDATTPQEFADVLARGAADLNEGQLAELGNYALDQSLASASGADNRAWQDIGGPLVRGEYRPPGGGGGGGGRVQGKLPTGLTGLKGLEAARKLYPRQGEEPVPPPPGLSMEPSEADEWFGQQYPPAVPGEQPLNIFELPRPTYMSDVDERRAQAQRIAYEQALLQAGGSPSDIPWATWDTPPVSPDYSMESATDRQQRMWEEQAQVNEGERVAVRNQIRNGFPIPNYLRDTYEAMLASGELEGEAYQPPAGGYATLEEAAAAGSPVAQQYLEETGYQTPPYTPDENYVAPPGGYPTLEAAAAAGSPAAAQYLEETGYTTPWSRPFRHPEEPWGGEEYERQLVEERQQITGGLTPEEIARIFPQGTGAITAANYGGGPRPAGPPPSEAVTIRTGETGLEPATEDQIQQYLENARRAGGGFGGRIRTGETAGRTEAERRRLARERTEEDWEYDPTTGVVNRRVAARNAFRRAYQERSHALVARQQEANRIYGAGSGFGQAMAAVYRAHLSGASPLQQVYAQRVQNVANAGIPIGAQPGLISY